MFRIVAVLAPALWFSCTQLPSLIPPHPPLTQIISVGGRFYVSGKGTREGVWVHLRGANSMGVSGLGYEKPLVGAR